MESSERSLYTSVNELSVPFDLQSVPDRMIERLSLKSRNFLARNFAFFHRLVNLLAIVFQIEKQSWRSKNFSLHYTVRLEGGPNFLIVCVMEVIRKKYCLGCSDWIEPRLRIESCDKHKIGFKHISQTDLKPSWFVYRLLSDLRL